MKASVVSIKDFFKITCPNDEDFFEGHIKYYSIPKYQREYKWESKMVEDLFYDIEVKDKFLGIIALEEKDECYEIVDGQQRLTTIFLMMIEIFNFFSTTKKMNEDQSGILEYIAKPNVILKNETIGNIIDIYDNKIEVNISPEKDIYRQRATFCKLIGDIKKLYSRSFKDDILDDEIDRSKLESFKRKVFDCKVLVFINNSIRENESTEEIYVDINQKSQHLDYEDIYKGYCFQKTSKSHHDELKLLWQDIKGLSFEFIDDFGFKNLSTLLYIYYLSQPKTFSVAEALTIKQRHILNKATSTDIFKSLRNIKSYSEIITRVYQHVKDPDYMFEDVTCNSNNYKNTLDYIGMKLMIKGIMSYRKVQYHKLPFFVFIEKLYFGKSDLHNCTLGFDELRKVITNYYLYSVFFIRLRKEKSKKLIEKDNIRLIKELKDGISKDNIKLILNDIKKVRKKVIDDVIEEEKFIFEKFNLNAAYELYSLLDCFDRDQQKLKKIYSREEGFNDEHLIVHQSKKVEWCNNDDVFEIDVSKFSHYKEKMINHLILPISLNEELESFDIVEKVKIIKDHYTNRRTNQLNLPNHIKFYIDYIESMKEYNDLVELKKNYISDKEEIESKYLKFINKYFDSEDSGYSLDIRRSLLSKFKEL